MVLLLATLPLVAPAPSLASRPVPTLSRIAATIAVGNTLASTVGQGIADAARISCRRRSRTSFRCRVRASLADEANARLRLRGTVRGVRRGPRCDVDTVLRGRRVVGGERTEVEPLRHTDRSPDWYC